MLKEKLHEKALQQIGLCATVQKEQCRRLNIATVGTCGKNTVHREPPALAPQCRRFSSGTAGIIKSTVPAVPEENHQHWGANAGSFRQEPPASYFLLYMLGSG